MSDKLNNKKRKKTPPKAAVKARKSSPENKDESVVSSFADEDNIPVQSLSEMLAMGRAVEEKPENGETDMSESKPDASVSPPLTPEEEARIAQAEDVLDRDLENARKKKLREEAYNKRLRESERKSEAERLERARQAEERAHNAQDAARKRAELRAAQAAIDASQKSAADIAEAEKNAAKRKKLINKAFNRNIAVMRAGKFFLVIFILLITAYFGAFVYVRSENDKYYAEIEPKLGNNNRIVDTQSKSYRISPQSPLSSEEKLSKGLCEWLSDSDSDGLSDYYEINTSHTDPNNPDCDGDGVLDGREIRAELDPHSPSTDGVTPDGEVIIDISVSGENVSADIKGIPKTALPVLERFSNNSIQGTPGLVGAANEFYSDKAFDSCTLTFTYSDSDLGKWEVEENALSVYRFDSEKLAFEKLASSVNTANRTVSCQVDRNGIYALCDTSIIMRKGNTNIFFLIDNSGSMYPEELCAGSEENDVEFKRLDFAVDLIDMLGTEANYGAGEFSGSYAPIAAVSNNYEEVKGKISDIRNQKRIFSGTDIAGAVTSAVAEFPANNGSDKNYLILLTDGMPSTVNVTAEKQALELARKNNITVFTIGLGKQIDTEYLFGIAEQTNGQFFQASNADALANIYSKIQSFMSYNQVTIEEETGQKGFIVADSGFNVLRDGIGYHNFRSDFAPYGADAGIAGLIRAYYTGELGKTESAYKTADGKTVGGYDISGLESFSDEKIDLGNVEMNILKAYDLYLVMNDKWDFGRINGGTLQFSEETRDFVDKHGLKVVTAEYSYEAPEQTKFMEFLRTITFGRLKSFNSYECVLIDSSLCEGDDLAVMEMIRWFSGISEPTEKSDVYDFGYDGDTAFDMLINELTKGSPAVIIFGGSAMNAVRIVRDAENPDLFVIDAYDSNSPKRNTIITLKRTPVYDGVGTPVYQYTASRGGVSRSLQVVITK